MRRLVPALVCAVPLLAVGAVGVLVGQPWLFPSLGPTVVVMLTQRSTPAAHWPAAVVGHVVAVAAGAAALAVAGHWGDPPATVAGLDVRYVVGAAAAVAVTEVVLSLVRLPHPPAAATTLLVALGILQGTQKLLVVLAAAVVVTGLCTLLRTLLPREPEPSG